MKKLIAILLFALTAFAEQLVIDNQTSYPSDNQKIAIEWASSAQEVDASNKALMYGEKFNGQLKVLKQNGEIKVSVPKKAEYFRIVSWSKGEKVPSLSTNWIDIVPGTTYTLKTEHLVPVAIMPGSGC